MDFVQDRQLHRKSRRNRLFCAKPPGPFPRREGERHSEDSLALGGCPQDAVPAPSRLREAGTDADASGGRGAASGSNQLRKQQARSIDRGWIESLLCLANARITCRKDVPHGR